MIGQAGDVGIDVAGEQLVLLPERAVWWPARDTLLVADLHWGKSATFRAHGIPVPAGTTNDTLTRLAHVLTRTAARRLIVLGDLLHAREGRSASLLAAIARWRAGWRDIEILAVRGNHDSHAGDPPAELGMRCVDAPTVDGPFVLAHHPARSPEGFVFAGHLHPAVVLRGPARESARLPCFWVRDGCLVLPAFGAFTGTASITPDVGDRVFAIADGVVLAV